MAHSFEDRDLEALHNDLVDLKKLLYRVLLVTRASAMFQSAQEKHQNQGLTLLQEDAYLERTLDQK